MKTFQTLFIAGTFATLNVLCASAFAAGKADQANMGANKMAQAAGDAVMSEAEVRKVDLPQGKITLKHGEIKNLDMPPMTMVFTVKDKAMLDSVKPGDKVKFRATNENGKMTVVEMALAK